MATLTLANNVSLNENSGKSKPLASLQKPVPDPILKKLIAAEIKSRSPRPESRLSTLYKTGYVPNANTKETLRITKRARFSTQDHLLTYPIYKSVYSGFSNRHPQVVRLGEGAIKRADAIPPIRATLDFKDKAAEKLLKTADVWIPNLKTVEVQDLRQPFDNLFLAVDSALHATFVKPTNSGLDRVRRAIKTLGNKISSIAIPLMPRRLREQLERIVVTDTSTESPITTTDNTQLSALYEEQYQILVKILDNETPTDCNFCDLVKFLYNRSSNDTENGGKLRDLILQWGLEAARNANIDGANLGGQDIGSSENEPVGDNGSVGVQLAGTASEGKGSNGDLEKTVEESQHDGSSGEVDDRESERRQHLDEAPLPPTVEGRPPGLVSQKPAAVALPKARLSDGVEDEISSSLSISMTSKDIPTLAANEIARAKSPKTVRFTDTVGHSTDAISEETIVFASNFQASAAPTLDFDPGYPIDGSEANAAANNFSEYAYQLTDLRNEADNTSSLYSSAFFSLGS